MFNIKKSILGLKNYRQLYIAGALSELGSFMTESALMVHIYKLSGGQQSYLGISHASFLIFLTLGSLIGGPLGEKGNRRNILIWTEIIRIPAVIAIMFAGSIWMIIALQAIIAICTGIFNPSRQAMVNDLVPQDRMLSANSLFGTTWAVLHMVAPLAGVMIYDHFGGIQEVLYFDLASYFLGIFFLARIAYLKPKNKEKSKISDDFKKGMKYLFDRADLRALHMNSIVTGLAIGIVVPLILPFATNVLGKPEKFYGYLMYAFGMGGIIGGILSKKIRFPMGKISMVCTSFEAVFMIWWVNTHHFYFNAVVLFLWGVLVFIRIPNMLNYLSKYVHSEYLTRMHSTLDMSFVIPNVSGGIIVAMAGKYFSTYEILQASALAFLVITVLRIPTRSVAALYRGEAPEVERKLNLENTV